MHYESIAKTTEFQTRPVLVAAKTVLLLSFNDEELNRYRVASTQIEAFGKNWIAISVHEIPIIYINHHNK